MQELIDCPIKCGVCCDIYWSNLLSDTEYLEILKKLSIPEPEPDRFTCIFKGDVECLLGDARPEACKEFLCHKAWCNINGADVLACPSCEHGSTYGEECEYEESFA